jgi:hypothetical protein
VLCYPISFLSPKTRTLSLFYIPLHHHFIPLIAQETEDICTHIIENRHLTMIRSLQSSEEGTELPLPLGKGTSANSTTSDAFGNPTNLGLGSLSLKLNQRVGVGVLQLG